MESTYPRHWYIGWDAKRQYQRNMLLGMAVALLCAGIVAGLIIADFSSDNPPAVSLLGGSLPPAHAGGYSGPVGDQASPSSVERVVTKSLVAANGWPTAGFIEQIRIIPDVAITVADATPNDWSTPILPEISDGFPGMGEGHGSGSGFGDGDEDFGLPEDGPLLPSVKSHLDLSGIGMSGPSVNAGFDLPGFIQPDGWMIWPRTAKESDTGYVTWTFVVDEHGRFESDGWELLEEQPPGKGFAQAVKDYLIFRCKIHPEIIGGQKKQMRITIRTVCCVICTPSVEVIRGHVVANIHK